MAAWAKYPFVRVAGSFIAGILAFHFTGKDLPYAREVFAVFVLVFSLFFWFSRLKRSAGLTFWAGMLGLFAFAVAGFVFAQEHVAAKDPQHLLHRPAPDFYTGVVNDFVVEKPGSFSTTLALQQIQLNGNWQAVTGMVQVMIRKVPGQQLKYGDVLLVKGAPAPVPPPANPAQFDYGKYLQGKNVWHQHFIFPNQYKVIGFDPPSGFMYGSMLVRRKLDAIFKSFLENHREYAIATALVLGVKDELDNDIRKAYADTGTMHVLAVSGLHVGLLFVVLNWVFRNFHSTLPRRIFSAAVMLLVIWAYGFVAGLGASILRAVLMFSFVAVAAAFRKELNIYNSLAAAAFLLLAFNPNFIFDVGFQLSFLAVLGIVYLQPKLYRLYQPDNKWTDQLWQLIAVSAAAQLATFPLGLYYFHQFPVYFLFSNLFAVPLSTLILYGGFLLLAVSWAGPLAVAIAFLFEKMVWLMNELTIWTQRWPLALLDGFTLTPLQTWLLYGFLILLVLFWVRKRLGYFAGATVCMVAFSVLEVQADRAVQQPQLVFYQVPGQTVVGLLEAPQALVLADTVLPDKTISFAIQPHLWQRNIRQAGFGTFSEKRFKNAVVAELPEGSRLLVWRGQRVLFLKNKLPQEPPPAPLAVDYLVLQHNLKLKPGQLSRHFRFRTLVLDGTNKRWYVQQQAKVLQQAGIPVHVCAEAGALVADL